MKIHFVCRSWKFGLSRARTQLFYDILKAKNCPVTCTIVTNIPQPILDECVRALHDIKRIKPDWVVVTSRSMGNLVRNLKSNGIENIVVHDPDSVLNTVHDMSFRILAGLMDVLIHEHKGLADKYGKYARSGGYWLPACFDLHMEPNAVEKKYDVGFAGHVSSYRGEVLSQLFQKLSTFKNIIHDTSKDGILFSHDLGNFYASCKIVVDLPRTLDAWPTDEFSTSSRLFQILGAGSLFMLNYTPGIDLLFEPGKHLVMYKDEDDLVEKARYYLTHDDEREKIAKAGQALVYEKHLCSHRAMEFWELLERLAEK